MRDEYCSKRFVSENRMTSANLGCGKDKNGKSGGNQKKERNRPNRKQRR